MDKFDVAHRLHTSRLKRILDSKRQGDSALNLDGLLHSDEQRQKTRNSEPCTFANGEPWTWCREFIYLRYIRDGYTAVSEWYLNSIKIHCQYVLIDTCWHIDSGFSISGFSHRTTQINVRCTLIFYSTIWVNWYHWSYSKNIWSDAEFESFWIFRSSPRPIRWLKNLSNKAWGTQTNRFALSRRPFIWLIRYLTFQWRLRSIIIAEATICTAQLRPDNKSCKPN